MKKIFLTIFALSTFALLLPSASAISTDYLYEFGMSGTADGELGGPIQSSLNSVDNVYVIENGNDRVSVFDSSGTFLFTFGSFGTGNGQFIDPSGLVVGPSDNVYVLDKNNRRVQIFDPSGNFLGKFGSIGSATGQFNLPQGIAVDKFENIFVADTFNQRIQKFDSNGNHLLTFGSAFSSGNLLGFKDPSTIAIADNGNIYVTDTRNHRVQVFDPDGISLFTFGSFGTGNGQFTFEARGIGIDESGNVFVGDLRAHRYQVFDLNGNFITTFGSFGTGNSQFNLPSASPGFDSKGNVFITESRNDRVQVFGNADSTSPIVTVPSDITQKATSELGASVTFTATANDDTDGIITPTCLPSSNSIFPLGDTIVECTAQDAAGNTGNASFTVTVNPAPLQTQKSFAINILNDLKIDASSDKTINKLDKAIKNIAKSQEEKNWETGDTLTKKGKKVFDGEKKAVKELLKIIKKDHESNLFNTLVSGVIDDLVRIDSELANNAVEDAKAFAGEKKADKEIVKAEKELVKATEDIAKDKPDKAIDHYKKAWEHAQKAMKHQVSDDEESEDD